MKQAHSETTRYRSTAYWWAGESSAARNGRRTDKPPGFAIEAPRRASFWLLGQVLMALWASLWFLITLPFRLIFWCIAWLGRLTAVVLGFSLMVVGMALWAGPLFFIGIPLFFLGLVITLRCLD